MCFDKIFTGQLSIELLKMCEWIMEFLQVYQCIFNNSKCLAMMSQCVNMTKKPHTPRNVCISMPFLKGPLQNCLLMFCLLVIVNTYWFVMCSCL